MSHAAPEAEVSPVPGYPSIDSFNTHALKCISSAIKASNALPTRKNESWDYYTTFEGFRQVSNAQRKTIEDMMVSLLQHNGIKAQFAFSDIGTCLDMVAQGNDHILDKVGVLLDEAKGLKKKESPLVLEVAKESRNTGSWNRQVMRSHGASPNEVRLLAAKNLCKPQITFRSCIDNSPAPFVPQLKDKPHSKKPLSILREYDAEGHEFCSHPYLFELEHLQWPETQLKIQPEVQSTALPDTPCQMVDSVKSLQDMIHELKQCTEIGVDLEAHSYRSFLGLTCLIQISTSGHDYLVDPFPIWSDLSLLNEVFADPNILKIFHGGFNDILWLQRDFFVYVVNLFDTYIAAKVLELPRGCRSLGFLLQHYCNTTVDKRFQLADWRMRPLTEEMLLYARSDSHYLIDIYRKMKRQLLDKGNEQQNLLRSVFSQSNQMCMSRFEKPRSNYLHVLQSCKAKFNSQQVQAFREMFRWRDHLARSEDESEAYVLPNHMMLKICSELPREMQGILACCNPIPPLVRQYLPDLHQIILKARDVALSVVSLEEEAQNSTPLVAPHDWQDTFINRSLDLAHFADDEAHLAVLLEPHQVETCAAAVPPASQSCPSSSISVKPNPDVNVFCLSGNGGRKHQDMVRPFLSPFERYQMVNPYLQASNDQHDKELPTDQERLESIKKHFDALTKMTPAEVQPERHTPSPDSQQSDDDPLPDPDAMVVLEPATTAKPVTQGLRPFRKPRKRKKGPAGTASQTTEETDIESKKVALDFSRVDYSQYSGGSRKAAAANTFPWDPKDLKGKDRKKKQRYKPQAGKSISYKK